MEYDKLTKAELIELLQDQQHLAAAVEAKDKEITQLKESDNKKIQELQQRVDNILKEYEGSIKKEQLEKLTKQITEERDYAMEIANNYIRTYTDFLKQTQQNLEMAIFTEGLISKKIKNRGE